jgi:cell division septation protein DedD
MSDFPYPSPHPENLELAAANRRLTTAILGMTLLTGLVACLSYLAGRTVTHIRTEAATVVRPESPAAPVVVTPNGGKPSPAAPIAEAPVAPVAPVGGIYFQVGLMDPVRDRSMQERLEKLGYTVRLMPMENNAEVSRVLVGPAPTAQQQQQLQAKLAADGFQCFPRRL